MERLELRVLIRFLPRAELVVQLAAVAQTPTATAGQVGTEAMAGMPPVSGQPLQAVELVGLVELVELAQQMARLELPDQIPQRRPLLVPEPLSSLDLLLSLEGVVDSAVRQPLAEQVVPAELAVMPSVIHLIPLILVHREPLVELVAPGGPVALVAPAAMGAMLDQSMPVAMEPW